MKLERVGPYKLEKILGRGGMGTVYVGLNQETGERAAVKILNPVLSDDPTFRERFKSEVDSLKKLLHPNIVQLFGYGEQDDALFYVMELVEGRSLQDELFSGRRFQWREVARIGIDVARALKHAHDRGVIHRDLKPANLLIDSHDHVKLTDFGIAKLYGATNLTVDGGVLGTADYMSPEQAEGKQVTSRCDLYSLGSVLFALLTGRPPFSGTSLPQVIQGLRFEKPILVRRINPEIPEELETIVSQLLEKDPQKRIPTALALAHRLKAMEHALSMETQVAAGADEMDEFLDGDPDFPPGPIPLGVTAPLPPQTELSTAVRPTLPAPQGAPAGGPAPPEGRAPASSAGRPADQPPVSITLARAATRAEGAPPPEEPPPAPARKSVFTTVSQDELGRSHAADHDDEHPLTAWLKIGLLTAAVLVLVAAIAYYALWPPSADTLHARIKAAEQRGVEQLSEVDSELTRFLATFPNDPRRDEVQQLKDEVELHRLQRSFENRARRNSGDPLSPIEQAYLDAVRKRATDPAGALEKFQALVDVFEGSQQLGKTPEEHRTRLRCLELARQEIERLTRTVEASTAADKELLAARLAAADELAATDPDAARKIWLGIVHLYGDQTWARELVEQARTRLKSASAGP